jgi:hypothetical protein
MKEYNPSVNALEISQILLNKEDNFFMFNLELLNSLGPELSDVCFRWYKFSSNVDFFTDVEKKTWQPPFV